MDKIGESQGGMDNVMAELVGTRQLIAVALDKSPLFNSSDDVFSFSAIRDNE